MLLEPFVPNNLSISHSFFTLTYLDVYDFMSTFGQGFKRQGATIPFPPSPLGQNWNVNSAVRQTSWELTPNLKISSKLQKTKRGEITKFINDIVGRGLKA